MTKSRICTLEVLKYIFKLGSTIYIIGTSIYDIKDDVTTLRKEHGLLLIGIVSLSKVGYELYRNTNELKAEIKQAPTTLKPT